MCSVSILAQTPGSTELAVHLLTTVLSAEPVMGVSPIMYVECENVDPKRYVIILLIAKLKLIIL